VAHDHVGVLWMLDAMPAPGDLEAEAQRLAGVNPRMRATYDPVARCWRERPGFDAAGQVIYAKPSSDMAAMLRLLAGHYVDPLLDDARPPWRAILLPTEGRGPALCFLAHHAFTDGMRGFHLARAFAGVDPPVAPRRMRARLTPAAGVEMVRASLADIMRRPARALRKQADSGRRAFHSAVVETPRGRAIGRPDLLARALATGIAEVAGARAVSLMVPRDVGRGGDGGNAFLPELRDFRFGAGGVWVSPPARRLAARAAADRARMALLARLPASLANAGYHRWANGFDALCTVLPDLFARQTIAGARVTAAFGVPPLIWRQPLAAAMIVGRKHTTMLLAYDPAAIDGGPIMAATLRAL
jgi:hypothetical protein